MRGPPARPAGRPIPGLTGARTRLATGGRERDDWYRTPPHVTEALLAREAFGPIVWDPCCGDGAMAEVVGRQHVVVASDLVDRGFGTPRVDFLLEGARRADHMIVNPPFRLADEFALWALQLGVTKLAVLQRLAWLEGMGRHAALWGPRPPARVWVFAARATLWRGDDPNPPNRGGVMALAWYVWESGHQGAPALGWIA